MAKIDNALLKRLKRDETKKRKVNNREKIAYFLIVCEGEKTEPNYFSSFSKNIKSDIYSLELDIKGEGSNTRDLVRRAIEYRNKAYIPYDRVWVVMDKDSFTPDDFNGAIAKAQSNNIRVAWTNEAFELWYLLHFQYRVTAMSRDDFKRKIEIAINQKITAKNRSAKKFKYQKNSKETSRYLLDYGSQEKAIKNAVKLMGQHNDTNYALHNPCTTVHLLVQELIGKSKELNDDIDTK